MNQLLKGLLALHLMFLGTPVVEAQNSSHSPSQKVTDDFLSYIHTVSPIVDIDLVKADQTKVKGAFAFETYALDLSLTKKADAKTWTLKNMNDARGTNPALQISVISVTDPAAVKKARLKGRGPAAAAPAVPMVIAMDIAKAAGVRLSDKFLKPSTSGKKDRRQIIPVGVVLIEKVNGLPVNWTFIETHGFGVESSVAIASTVGTLSGQIQFVNADSRPGFTPKFMRTYSQLFFENQRLQNDYVSQPFYAPSTGQSADVRFSNSRVKYVSSIGYHAAISQLPHIVEWVNSFTSVGSVMGVAESGMISIVSSGATKSWHVALETSLQHQRTISPELEERIRVLQNRQRWGMFFGERVFGTLVGSAFGTGPEAWFVFTITGAAGLAKLFWDYHKVIQTLNSRETEVIQPIAFTPDVIKPPVFSCRDILARRPTVQVVGL